MHPNLFLQTLWRLERKNQVFVAMSFEERFNSRFENVFLPAIESSPFDGLVLKAYRVDNSKTGESILTEIIDGIAHSYLILADVSVIDIGAKTGFALRNGNVMYELGLALACRSPSDVLLVRDDDSPFLFDVSTIPHLTLEFNKAEEAAKILRDAIHDRVREASLLYDARVELMVSQLSDDAHHLLQIFGDLESNSGVDLRHSIGDTRYFTEPTKHGLDDLLAKNLIRVFGKASDGGLLYSTTDFGYAVARLAKERIRMFTTSADESSET